VDELTPQLSTIAGLLGYSARDLVALMQRFRTQIRERDEQAKAARVAQRVAQGDFTDLLTTLYGWARLRPYDLELYSFRLDSEERKVAVATRRQWTDLSIPLNGTHEVCRLVDAPSVNPFCQPREAAPLIAQFEAQGSWFWDSPAYRLVDINIERQRLRADFASEQFFAYRFGPGLLIEETINALGHDELSIVDLVRDRRRWFPLRETRLANGADILNLQRRICAGGALALFALARPAPYEDFILPVQRRSQLVADTQAMLSVVPKAYHEPMAMVSRHLEVNVSQTIFREIYEELFGGKEVERDVRRLRYDWYLRQSPPLDWIRTHPGDFVLECVAFGFSLLVGNYEFPVLAAVPNTEFWDRYGDDVKSMWEMDREILFISSRDEAEIRRVISLPDWTPEGLFAFIEALTRLASLYPDRVALPPLSTSLST
jgi:hypothetical protein